MTQAAAGTTQIPGATLPPRFGRFIGGLRDNPPGRMLRYPDLPNMRLRCHLGIDPPPAGRGIKVGNIERTWEVGHSIVFDDSFEHEAWNSSSRRRVVLIIDFWHPGLSDDEVSLTAGFRRHAVNTGMGVLRYRQQTVRDQSS